MRWLRWGGVGLLVLVVVGVLAWWWLLVESHTASPGSYAVDIGEVRRLADSHAGAKPRRVRVVRGFWLARGAADGVRPKRSAS